MTFVLLEKCCSGVGPGGSTPPGSGAALSPSTVLGDLQQLSLDVKFSVISEVTGLVAYIHHWTNAGVQ